MRKRGRDWKDREEQKRRYKSWGKLTAANSHAAQCEHEPACKSGVINKHDYLFIYNTSTLFYHLINSNRTRKDAWPTHIPNLDTFLCPTRAAYGGNLQNTLQEWRCELTLPEENQTCLSVSNLLYYKRIKVVLIKKNKKTGARECWAEKKARAIRRNVKSRINIMACYSHL